MKTVQITFMSKYYSEEWDKIKTGLPLAFILICVWLRLKLLSDEMRMTSITKWLTGR